MTTPEICRHMLIDVAKSFTGVREESNNWSPVIAEFQKEIDGKADREPWCCCFVQFCVNEVDRRMHKIRGGELIRNILFRSERVLDVWKKTPLWARTEDPEPGMIMLWWHFRDGKPTGAGHVAVIEAVERGVAIRYRTIEGNTGPDMNDGSVNREGDGVYQRYRLPVGSPSMRVLGYIDPWAEPAEDEEPSKS